MTSSPQNSLQFNVQENVAFALDFDHFLIQFTDIYRKLARASNTKDIGQYYLTEILCGQVFFGATPQVNRGVYRKVFNFGAIAAGATLNIAHGVNVINTVTRLYGTCLTNVPDDRPIPFADVTLVTNQISLLRNGINLVVTNGATSPPIVSGIIILEYLKN